MSEQTLKDLLKPPFIRTSSGIMDSNGNCRIIVFCPRCDELADFVTVALNEKVEREWSGPLRWIRVRSLGIDWIDCPKCKHGLQEGTKDLNYCPHCGVELGPPEGEKG